MIRGTRRRREIAAAYALMAPSLLLVLGVLAYPVAWEVWVSLTDFSSHSTRAAAFVGLANYAKLAKEVDFWSALLTTVLYFAVTTTAKLVLGVALALLLAWPGRGRALGFLAVFLPWAYPGGVSVIGWFWLLNPPITTSYSTFMGGIKYAVDGALGTGAWAFTSVALFNIWRGSSFTAIFLLAGLNAIPTELFEDAPARDALGLAAAPRCHPASAPPLHGARRLPVGHHRLRRSRQRLDAHGRPRRLSRARHPGVLARDQGGPVRGGRGALAVAGAACSCWPCSCSSTGSTGANKRTARHEAPARGAGDAPLLAALYGLFPVYYSPSSR